VGLVLPQLLQQVVDEVVLTMVVLLQTLKMVALVVGLD
jgi:hypothetical protein